MKSDDMLRVSLGCSALAARGGEWAEPLARGAAGVIGADISYAVRFTTDPADDRWRNLERGAATYGVKTPGHEVQAVATSALSEHPTIGICDWTRSTTARVSDAVRIESFWTTQVWRDVHSYGDGRYPASVVFGRFGPMHVFLGVQRCTRDFSDEDMAVLDTVREPLCAALAFRYAWEAAIATLRPDDRDRWSQQLTHRERQVSALVAHGWTDAQIATHLGISRRTVRKHLDNVRAKWAAPNRAAVASLYERRRY